VAPEPRKNKAEQNGEKRAGDQAEVPQLFLAGRFTIHVCTQSVEFEFSFPRIVGLQPRLIGLGQQEILEHQVINLGPHEAAIGILGGAHDGFTTDIE